MSDRKVVAASLLINEQERMAKRCEDEGCTMSSLLKRLIIGYLDGELVLLTNAQRKCLDAIAKHVDSPDKFMDYIRTSLESDQPVSEKGN